MEKLANDERKLAIEFGKHRANKIRARLTQLMFASNLEELRHFPGNYHELTGNRKGQWACDLDQPYRLVFTPHEIPLQANESDHAIRMEITGVEILEIVNYHKEK